MPLILRVSRGFRVFSESYAVSGSVSGGLRRISGRLKGFSGDFRSMSGGSQEFPFIMSAVNSSTISLRKLIEELFRCFLLTPLFGSVSGSLKDV